MNAPPSINITVPNDGAQYTAPAMVSLAADATDADGTISKVDFFNGTALIGTVTNAPYTLDWSNVAAGNYSLSAKATDNNGATTASSAISISVNAPQVHGVFYLHTDHLNTPRMVTDSSKKVVWSWNSDPFGATAPHEDPDGDGVGFVYNARFAGQYFDGETGLHYNYFRDYDPKLGRYIESDPIGLDGGINSYAYVGGNPLRYTDPTGEFGLPGVITIGFIAIGTGYTLYQFEDCVKNKCEKTNHCERADQGDTRPNMGCRNQCFFDFIFGPKMKKGPRKGL